MSSETIIQLAQRIRDLEANQRPLAQSVIPLPIPMLPGGGLPGGALLDVLAALPGSGAWTLALVLARYACGQRKTLVIADGQCSFYPPAAARLGIDLRRTLILRPQSKHGEQARRLNGVTALVQALRCQAVGAVIGHFERLTSAEYRALQLAAQSGGGVGFLLRPVAARGVPSFAEVRLGVQPACGAACASATPQAALRRLRVDILRARGDKAGQVFVLEIDHETGNVRVPSLLADATSLERPARAS